MMSTQTNNNIPLCVDLDGTLLKTDTLHELFLASIKQKPWIILLLPFLLLKGKHHLKEYLSKNFQLNVALLPRNETFFEFLQKQYDKKRELILVTGCHEKTANAIADHYGLFKQTHATSEYNLTGHKKAELLEKIYGKNNFDYAGNAAVDTPIWDISREKILVNADRSLGNKLHRRHNFSEIFDTRSIGLKTILKAIRIHQWTKNALLFIPALTSHTLFDNDNIMHLLAAFIAFSCCASFSYIVNDMFDLEADRKHHRKKSRPFASGEISIVIGFLLALLLLTIAGSLSLLLTTQFIALLVIYFILTNLYSLRLKQIPILDVSVLGGLYTLRVLAGAVAIDTVPTFWLIAFSSFLFFSLAIVKRLSELLYLEQNTNAPVKARGYLAPDISTLRSLGSSASIAAVLVLALYIDSHNVKTLYNSPRHLWLLCPTLLIWLGRVWLVTGRGKMHDDPVVFALKDRVSWLIFLIASAILVSATFY